MGYTRYWHRTEKPITQEFVDAVNNIIAESRKKGITIRNGLGEDEPIVTLDKVLFNGDGKHELDHETCAFTNTEPGFNFCKTARKPYDYTVREVLKVAEKWVSLQMSPKTETMKKSYRMKSTSDNTSIQDMENINKRGTL